MSAAERLLRTALRLGAGGTVTIAWIMETHDVSLATAKRDFILLAQLLPVVKEPVQGHENSNPPRQLRLLEGAAIFTKMAASRPCGWHGRHALARSFSPSQGSAP